MVTNARSRVWPVLLLLPALVLVYPNNARADRIDIDDPSELGSLVFSRDVGEADFFMGLITDVRYTAGIYSYIYAIQTSPYFPGEHNHLVSFAVSGHALEETWGAIRHTDPAWRRYTGDQPLNPQANTVESITPVFDGFLAVPGENSRYSWTVVYVQSPRLPSLHGDLTYTARGCILFPDPFGECSLPENIVTDSTQFDGFAVPTPEPATFVLFGLGLATLAAKRRASRHRRVARAR